MEELQSLRLMSRERSEAETYLELKWIKICVYIDNILYICNNNSWK